MSNFRICPINFFADATLTSSPAADSGFAVTNAQLHARDKTFRCTPGSPSTVVIEGNWGSESRTIDTFAMLRHNGHGGSVKLELFAPGSPTSTAYNSTALPIYTAVSLDGFTWGLDTASYANSDLSYDKSPYYLNFTAVQAGSFRVTLSNWPGSLVEVGQLWLGKYLEAALHAKFGMTVAPKTNTQQVRTKGGTNRIRPGESWRELKVDMMFATDNERARWRDLMNYVMADVNVLINVWPGTGGRQERDYIFSAHHATEQAGFAWNEVNFNQTVLTFGEV